MKKKRIDQLLVEKGFSEDLKQARAMLMAGQVIVNEQPVLVAGMMIPLTAEIALKEAMPYVSRGGYKLAEALRCFSINPIKAICADVGASTGGFTDVLLQHGALRVYAIDVGYGVLAWKLRQDARVVVMERTNARQLESLPEKVSLIVMDASFISIKQLLPAAVKWTAVEADYVVLVKPQFEAPKQLVEKGGVVRDRKTHRLVLDHVIGWCIEHHFAVAGLTVSPILGPAGNREFLLHLMTGKQPPKFVLEDLVENCLNQPLDPSP
jgi:23S rRNA (cytidine1920-2'-O)/16S rRNA (cytidine1409-2'-O)-methyltransferase